MKRWLIVAPIAMAAIAALVVGVSASFSWHRDEDAYIRHVDRADLIPHIKGASASDMFAYKWAREHPKQMIAEGDRACDWLRSQPDATSHADKFNRYTLMNIYIRTADIHARIPKQIHQAGVVGGAWAYLCRDVRDDKSWKASNTDD